MATVRPARTYWDARATNWCYFDAVAGSFVEHDGSLLAIGTDNTNPANATYYAAIQFDEHTAPSWASVGPIAGAARALLATVGTLARRDGGLGNVQITAISDPWDDTYTAAQMRALSIGAWGNISGLGTYRLANPNELRFGFGASSGNGYMLRVEPGAALQGGALRIQTTPAPIMRHFYQYSPTIGTEADATERATLSADALAVLASEAAPKHFNSTATVKTSEILPAESDTALSIVAGAELAQKSRVMEWPESWQLDIPAAGAVTVSLVSDTITSTLRGMPVESELSVILKDGTEETIGKQVQYIGDIVQHNDGTAELELRSPIQSILQAQAVVYSPYNPGTLEYDDEPGLYIIVDMLLNSGKLLYERTHYNDLAYLLKRFSGTFSPLTYATTDLLDTTVADMIAEIGPLYGICLAQAATGCVSFFHPAVYRPSLKVWTIDKGDCIPGGYSVIDRGADGQYGWVKVFNTDVTPGSSRIYPANRLPSSPGLPENKFDFIAQGSIFSGLTRNPAREAIGCQLTERLCLQYLRCELELGLKGLPIECGDVIKLTGTGLSTTTRFLVTSVSGDSNSGQVSVGGIHYPEALALSSSFEDTGIEGEWRWLDQTGTQTTANQSPGGSDADPSTCTLSGLSYEHWQGVMHDTGYVEWGSTLVDAAKHDVVDVCTMIDASTNIGGNVTNGPGASWGGEDYLPLLMWYNSANDEVLAVGIYRPGYSLGPGNYDNVNHRIFIGHIADVTATPFSFTNIDLSANGIVAIDRTQTGEQALAITVQWDDSENIKVYLDRQMVVEGDSYDKDDWDTFRIATQINVRIGCVRHLQTDAEITEVQRFQGVNGLDVYCP